MLVEKISRKGDDLCAALRVVAAAAGCLGFGYHVGAVQRIVQAAPTGVGRVERVTCIAHRHHQLGAGNMGNFRIDVRGTDRERLLLGDQVADLGQQRLVLGVIESRAGILPVPRINLRLQFVASLQQRGVAGRQGADQCSKSLPKLRSLHAAAGNGFVIDEIVKIFIYLDLVYSHGRSHRTHSWTTGKLPCCGHCSGKSIRTSTMGRAK